MTEQQIDRDHLRENAVEGGPWGAVVLVLLDQIDQAEAELDSWMTRAYDSEQREWEAEKRLAGWMEHWNATARTGAVDEVAAILEANTRADHAEARIAEEKHLRMKATAAATKAEARIEAVQDLIDQADMAGDWAVTCSRLQWAIDGTTPRALDGDA